MIQVIAGICCILGPICLGVWMATQGDEHNARSLARHSKDSAAAWKKYEAERKTRRFLGWAGLIMSIIGFIGVIVYTTR